MKGEDEKVMRRPRREERRGQRPGEFCMHVLSRENRLLTLESIIKYVVNNRYTVMHTHVARAAFDTDKPRRN